MDVRLPDGTTIRNVPEGTTKAQLVEKLRANGYDVAGLTGAPQGAASQVASAPANQRPALQGFLQDVALGAVRGAGSIGATILYPYDKIRDVLNGDRDPNLSGLVTGQQPISRNEERRQAMDEALRTLGADTESLAFKGGKLAGEIAGTAGLPTVVARPLSGIAPRLAQAVSTGGFRTGAPAATTAAGRAGDLATRVVGGGVAGGVSAAAVDPADTSAGAAIGAVLPPALRVAGAAGGAVGKTVRQAMTPRDVQAARAIADTSRMAPDQLRAALATQVGPSLVPGDLATVPQILQSMDVSQLARAVHNAGGMQVAEREGANALARVAALDRISPVSGTTQQAADNFGNALEKLVRPAERAADRATSAAYNAIDPRGETAINLPLDELRAIVDKYLGPGTFGKGFAARQGLQAAEAIGTEQLPALRAAQGAGGDRTLAQAVRRLGGLSMREADDLGGELRGLRGDVKNLVSSKGMSPARMAEALYQRGYLADDDATTLLAALRDAPDSYAMGQGERAFAAAREAAMGEPPGAETIARAVPYRELDNLRKSLGDALRAAERNDQSVDAGALRSMIGALDAKVEQVASGRGDAGEVFPADIADAWRKARELHRAQQERFFQGPQASMFRRGADGLPVARGGELAPKFINATRGQSDDAAALRRLVEDDPAVMDAARNFIATDAASQTNALGQLTNSKFGNWRDARSGMLQTLLPDADQALLAAIGRNLERSDSAQRLGMASGSNTLQNAQSALDLGLLDSPAVNVLASRIPLLGSVTGPALGALKESARKSKANALGQLLADPLALDEALARMQAPNALQALLENAQRVSGPALYRAAPVLLTAP